MMEEESPRTNYTKGPLGPPTSESRAPTIRYTMMQGLLAHNVKDKKTIYDKKNIELIFFLSKMLTFVEIRY